MDDFDRYFLECSKYVFPTDLIEDLNSKLILYGSYLERLENLEYIVSEAWLGSTDINIFRALSSETRDVKTLYNEHNCFFHPYVGDLVRFQANLVDQYLTMGWRNNDPKFLSTSSLFPFRYKKRQPLSINFYMLVIQLLNIKIFSHPYIQILIIRVTFTYYM